MKRRFDNAIRDFSLAGTGALVLSAVAWTLLFAVAIHIDTASAASKRASSETASKTLMKGPKTQKKDPIRITSDRMEAYNKKNMIVFLGNVLAIQGAMRIQSDRLEVYVKKKEKTAKGSQSRSAPSTQKTSSGNKSGGTGQGSLERLVAIGNVLVNQGKKKFASADRLDYKESKGIAVLTGNPRAWENNNQVVGTKIELFLREGRTVVHGSRRRRVRVTLFPESQPGQSPKRTKSGVYGK